MEIISKRQGKVIELGSGSSLSVPMKTELLKLGVKKGDYVIITLKKDKIIIEKN